MLYAICFVVGVVVGLFVMASLIYLALGKD